MNEAKELVEALAAALGAPAGEIWRVMVEGQAAKAEVSWFLVLAGLVLVVVTLALAVSGFWFGVRDNDDFFVVISAPLLLGTVITAIFTVRTYTNYSMQTNAPEYMAAKEILAALKNL